ncbi:lipoprotein [Saccharopolyspora gloriosae]|uniref:4-hydroxy-3-methylbut-2-enyl diphosphate reductase n=1 Tax=Saccharopolyspora gloriosae TaxID=455344 RepID=A0A840NFX1_9PSEU|nr:1-hydroxy-2-methyl-2-butenyl 4-diphosphate reductase [Saccharopolyspora gloriosae]MBB5069153.1 4-hydroxy-3-methylbut-2-enyl diphosphate reductase [Saccharopolyspora gloriosae]
MARPGSAALGGGERATARVRLCAPLRCEALALRGASSARVLRTGFGPRRSALAAARLDGHRPLAVAGLAGGVGATACGVVVVADEVRDESGAMRLPGARVLADRLRAAGFAVLVGPISSADHVVSGPERAALATTGVVAVDMESAALARAADRRLRAVVRVVVDTAVTPLVHVRTPDRAVRALLRLRRLAPVLADWVAESGSADRRCRPGPRDPSQ